MEHVLHDRLARCASVHHDWHSTRHRYGARSHRRGRDDRRQERSWIYDLERMGNFLCREDVCWTVCDCDDWSHADPAAEGTRADFDSLEGDLTCKRAHRL